MRARSALFDVYGDHLRRRGDRAPVAALVRLLEPLGIAAPAVRTAVSRMVAQGWLEPVSLDSGPGYAATDQAIRRLDEAHARIYAGDPADWDGRWHLVLLPPLRDRARRQRVRSGLAWAGYAEISPGTWASPWPRPGTAELLAQEKVDAATAVATDFDPPTLPLAAWDLEALAKGYADWLAVERHAPTTASGDDDEDRAAYARRFRLVHEWRKFLFEDPGLPDELLPSEWPGRAARAHFTSEAARLAPGADRYVDRCLGERPHP